MKCSFQQYKSVRDLSEFDKKFTGLCESIVKSGIEFDKFWQEHALPVLLHSESCADEDQLILEFFGTNPMAQQMPQPFSQPVPFHTPQQMPQAPQQMQQMPQQGVDPKQQKLEKFQQKIDQQIDTIKKRFQVAMKEFLQAVTDDAKTQGDPHMWQVAQNFHKKITAAVEPVMAQFKQRAKFGKASYSDQFNQLQSQMPQPTQQSFVN